MFGHRLFRQGSTRRSVAPGLLIIAVLGSGVLSLMAAESSAAELLQQAQAAQAKGDRTGALALTTKAIEREPRNAKAHFFRGRLRETDRQLDKAVADYDRALQLQPLSAEIYQQRGGAHFKLGRIQESIADFDKFLQLAPQQEPYQWQRGISYYYAGRYEDGRKQFKLHQTVNPNDVENAVWHFLCVARVAGIEKARASLMPIKEDRRVPMMQIHALFAGRVKPEDVLAAAEAGNPSPARLNEQLFYAHLYLGLYYDAGGDEKLAREHILKAADEFKTDHYMADVARVHADILRKKNAPEKP